MRSRHLRPAPDASREALQVELPLVAADQRAVDQHVAHPGRLLGGQPLTVGRQVAHPPMGPGATVAGSKTQTSAAVSLGRR